MILTREVEVDVATAVAEMPWVVGVHALELGPAAALYPDALLLAVVLSPYSVTGLVEAHYALVTATGGHDVPGRITYVDDAQRRPAFMEKTRMIMPTPQERDEARARIAARRESAEQAAWPPSMQREIEAAFARLAEQAAPDAAAPPASGPPYRSRGAVGPIRVRLAPGPVLELVKDPFASAPKTKRVLVADADPQAATALAGLTGVEVVSVTDGWAAVDQLTASDFDLVLCALVVGELQGAKILRMIAKDRPHNASRIYFLAREETIAQGPPSSASGRVLARLITPVLVQSLLERG